jgi:hypothetical protein
LWVLAFVKHCSVTAGVALTVFKVLLRGGNWHNVCSAQQCVLAGKHDMHMHCWQYCSWCMCVDCAALGQQLFYSAQVAGTPAHCLGLLSQDSIATDGTCRIADTVSVVLLAGKRGYGQYWYVSAVLTLSQTFARVLDIWYLARQYLTASHAPW